jgi:arginase
VLDKVWLHVDLDVLDEDVMPAVDSPGSPGFDYAQLSALVGTLCASGRVAGADFAIYDPERDPRVRYAAPLVRCIADGVRARA